MCFKGDDYLMKLRGDSRTILLSFIGHGSHVLLSKQRNTIVSLSIFIKKKKKNVYINSTKIAFPLNACDESMNEDRRKGGFKIIIFIFIRSRTKNRMEKIVRLDSAVELRRGTTGRQIAGESR